MVYMKIDIGGDRWRLSEVRLIEAQAHPQWGTNIDN